MKKIFENVLDFLFETEDECVEEKSFFDDAKEMMRECFSSPKMAMLTLGFILIGLIYAFVSTLIAYIF